MKVRLGLIARRDGQPKLEAIVTNAVGVIVAYCNLYYILESDTHSDPETVGYFKFYPHFSFWTAMPEFWLDGKMLKVTQYSNVIISPEDVVAHINSHGELAGMKAGVESWMPILLKHMETREAVSLAVAVPRFAPHLPYEAAVIYAELHPELSVVGDLL